MRNLMDVYSFRKRLISFIHILLLMVARISGLIMGRSREASDNVRGCNILTDMLDPGSSQSVKHGIDGRLRFVCHSHINTRNMLHIYVKYTVRNKLHIFSVINLNAVHNK